ncbi:putative uncharacterized protein [Clostridium sp. CAG:533]|jgi:uncharacterized protein|nr:putative uncharacterized protein [Clostridium sp. CAG:533]
MKIDLRKLYSLASVDVDGTITFPEEKLKSAGIIRLEDVSVHGKAIINYEDEIELDLDLSGKMYLPCAISLEEVEVPFATKIEEIIGENNINNNFYLDLSDILWENIVLEIPIKVVKEGVQLETSSGKGWSVEEN